MLGRDLSKTIIVDNIPSNFKLQPKNGIYITTWTGEEGDCCLLNLMPVLELLVKKQVPDVRVGLEEISKYMEEQLQKGEQVDLEKVRFS
jgi:CTD small phosphatase-like protein 2